jgi:NAD(P)-dependent dehydrogenase (short-subunit alcohol dehydrogenase family)
MLPVVSQDTLRCCRAGNRGLRSLEVIPMARAVAPAMRARGTGRIVNIGSLVGKFLGPTNGAFAATKQAVEALSDVCARHPGHPGRAGQHPRQLSGSPG